MTASKGLPAAAWFYGQSFNGGTRQRIPVIVDRCTVCGDPAHASETDDNGRCQDCMRAAGDAPILPGTDESLPVTVGRNFGAWMVVAISDVRPGFVWARCACDKSALVAAADLESGRSRSCGCRDGAL